MYLHLATSGAYCIFWPDFLHKMARKSCYSLSRSGGSVIIKKLNKLFRMSRGPWSSSKFGKQLHDARALLVKGIQNGTVDETLLETWIPGVAKDQRVPMDQFKMEDLLHVLQRKAGPKFVKNKNSQKKKCLKAIEVVGVSLKNDSIQHRER